MDHAPVDISKLVFSSGAVWVGIGALVAVTLSLVGMTWRLSSWKTTIELQLTHGMLDIHSTIERMANEMNRDRAEWSAIREHVQDHSERIHALDRTVVAMDAKLSQGTNGGGPQPARRPSARDLRKALDDDDS